MSVSPPYKVGRSWGALTPLVPPGYRISSTTYCARNTSLPKKREVNCVMDTRSISLNQLMTLMILFLVGGSILANIGRYSGQNIWLVILLGGVLGTVYFSIYYRISKLNQHKGLPDILKNCFGKWLGAILITIYAGFFLFRSILIGNTMTAMTESTLMYGSNHRLIMSLLLIAVICGSLYGLKAIGRSSEILFFVTIICLIPFFVTVFSTGVFKYANLIPILAEGIGGIREDVFRISFFPFGDLVIFLMLFQFVPKQKKDQILSRSYIAILIAILLLISVNVTNIALLGSDLNESFLYPFYNAMQLAGMNGLLERLDPLAVIIIVITGYFKVVLYFYAGILATQSLSQKFKYKWILSIATVGVFILAPRIKLGNINFTLNILPFKILPIFELGIPLIVWIISEIKHRKKRKDSELLDQNKTKDKKEKLATT